MKKIILVLLLIGFLVVPNVALGSEAVARATCEAAMTQGDCKTAAETVGKMDPLNDTCEWNAEAGRCAYVPPVIPPLPEVGFLAALEWVVNFVFYLFATVAVIFIIVAAFQFLTAGGNTETIAKARTSILYAVIAIILAAMAMGIVTFIREQLGAL